MNKIPKILYLVLAVLIAVGGVGVYRALAITPGLYEVGGANTNCANLYQASVITGPESSLEELGPLFGFKYDGNPTTEMIQQPLVDNFPWVVTNGPQDPNNWVSILNVDLVDGKGKQFDWEASLDINAVIVKARDANAYVYLPGVYQDQGLSAPDGKDISHVEFCYNYELTATKTANAQFTRTYTWDITKEANGDYDGFIGDPAFDHDYVVSVDRTETDSAWAVAGTITVNNPTPFTVDFSVTDMVDGTAASVTCPSYSLAPGASVTCTYSAPLAGAVDGTNTATVTSSTSPVGGAVATAAYAFGEPTTTVGPTTVNVTDSFNGALGSASGDFTFPSYSKSFQCPSDPELYTGGVYNMQQFVNTATIDETGQNDSATVDLTCYAPLVSKDAATSYTKTYTWDITKDFDADYKKFIGDPATSHGYAVSVDQTITESAFAVAGDITVVNPAPMPMTVALVDYVDGVAATLDCGGTLVVPANSSATCGYSAPLETKTDGVNTATVTLNSIDFAASADYAFANATITPIGFPNVNVTDTNGQAWTASGDASWNYTRDFTCPTDLSLYVNGFYEVPDHINTAQITETGDFDTATVGLTCYAPVVDKDATAEWKKKYDWTITKTADPDSHIGFAGESFLSNYDVVVDQTVIDYGFKAYGTITVANPAGAPGPITVDVADAVNGTDAILDCGGTLTVAAGTTGSCDYTVDLPDATDRTNTATVTFNNLPFTATADVDFGDPIIEGEPEINVTDTYAGALGSASADTTFEYSRDFLCSSLPEDYAGDGIDSDIYPNTATIVETGQDADEDVTVTCYAPVVSKDAFGSFDKTYTWDVEKTVNPPGNAGMPGDILGWTWTVTVTKIPAADENFAVSGTISVTNPHPTGTMTVALADVLSDGTVASISYCETPAAEFVPVNGQISVPALMTATCAYTASPATKAELNTVTATLNAIDFEATAGIVWTGNESGDSAVLDDDQNPAFPITITEGGTWTYSDSHTCSTYRWDYNQETHRYNGEVNNTATVTWDDGSDSDSAKTSYACKAGFVELTKLTNGIEDPEMIWDFALYTGGFDGTLVASGTTPPSLLFADLALPFYDQYTVCELNAPAGWTSVWMMNGASITPYNPNTPENLGNLCVDFYVGTTEIVDGKFRITGPTTVSFVVDNQQGGGDPRTPGYWKNWNTCTGGGQAANAARNGGWVEGFWLLDDVLGLTGVPETGIIWDDIRADNFLFPIDRCELGVSILDTRDFSTGKQMAGDVGYRLAKHLLAAQANVIAGACLPSNIDLGDLIWQAEDLLDKVNFDASGPSGIGKRGADYELANTLAGLLDQYNNGMFCGSTYMP